MHLPPSAVRGFDRRRSTCLLSVCHGFSIHVVRVRRAGSVVMVIHSQHCADKRRLRLLLP